MFCEFCHCPSCSLRRQCRSSGDMDFTVGREVQNIRREAEVNITIFNLVEAGYSRRKIAELRGLSPTMISIRYAKGKRASELKSLVQFGAQPSERFLLPALKHITGE